MAAGISVKLSLNDSLFQAGIRRAGAAVASFGKTAASVGFKTLAAAVAGGAVAMIAGARHIINLGDDLLRMKRITGLSVSSLFILREAFEQAGTSAESIAPTIGRMQKNLFDASKNSVKFTAGLKAMGIDAKKFMALKPEEQFLLLGKTINDLPDGQRQAAAMERFGKSGLSLLPVFAELKDFDSSSLQKQAAVIEKNAEAFDNANDAIRRMKTNAQGLFVGLATKVAPMIANIGKRLEKVDFVAMGDKLADNLLRGVQIGLALFNDPVGVMKAFWAQAKVYVLQFGNWLIDAVDGAFPGMGAAILDAIDKTVAWGNILIGSAVQFGAILVAGVEHFGSKLKSMWISSGIPDAMDWMKRMGGTNGGWEMNEHDAGDEATRMKFGIGKSGLPDNFVPNGWNNTKSGGKFAGVSGGIGADMNSWSAKMTRIQTGGAGAGMIAKGNAALAAAKEVRKFATGADHLGVAAAEAAALLAKNKIAPALAKAAEQMNAIGLRRGNQWEGVHIKERDTYGTGNWRKASAAGTLRGASMAGTLSGAFGSTTFGGSSLKGASMESGFIAAQKKQKEEAAEKERVTKGIDLSNDLLGGIKSDIHELRMNQE